VIDMSKTGYWNCNPVVPGLTAAETSTRIETFFSKPPFFGIGETFYLPKGTYPLARKLVFPPSVMLVGDGGVGLGANYGQRSKNLTLLDCQHTDTGIDLAGSFSGMVSVGVTGQTCAGDAVGIKITGGETKLDDVGCDKSGKAALHVLTGGHRIRFCEFTAQRRPWSDTDGAGVLIENSPDSTLESCFIAAHGPAIFCHGGAGWLVHDCVLFNSQIGIHATCRDCTFNDNRIDSMNYEGILIDWNSEGCTFNGNAIHNNGARTTASTWRRAGIGMRSCHGCTADGNAFANWDQGVTQEDGTIDFNSPMHHGIVVGFTWSPVSGQPMPVDNSASGNAYEGMRTSDYLILGGAEEPERLVPEEPAPPVDLGPLEARVDTLEAQVAALLTEVAELQAENATEDGRITVLEGFRDAVKAA
jgi:hypothetical protein